MNLMMLLEMAAQGLGDRVAVGSREGGISYRQLYDQAQMAAARFRAARGDKVVLCDESSPAVPISLFGAAAAGVPYVPLNYRLPDDDLYALAERSAPGVAITDEAGSGRLYGVEGIQTVTRRDFLEDPAGGATPCAAPDWSMDPEEIAVLLYTSGTTGAPKTVVLRQKHLVSYILGSVEFMAAAEDEAAIVSVPPYHVAGVAAMLSTVPDEERDGELAPLHDAVVDRLHRRVDNIMAVHSLNPRGLRAHNSLYQSAMAGTATLRKVERELLALVVSLENHCHY